MPKHLVRQVPGLGGGSHSDVKIVEGAAHAKKLLTEGAELVLPRTVPSVNWAAQLVKRGFELATEPGASDPIFVEKRPVQLLAVLRASTGEAVQAIFEPNNELLCMQRPRTRMDFVIVPNAAGEPAYVAQRMAPQYAHAEALNPDLPAYVLTQNLYETDTASSMQSATPPTHALGTLTPQEVLRRDPNLERIPVFWNNDHLRVQKRPEHPAPVAAWAPYPTTPWSSTAVQGDLLPCAEGMFQFIDLTLMGGRLALGSTFKARPHMEGTWFFARSAS